MRAALARLAPPRARSAVLLTLLAAAAARGWGPIRAAHGGTRALLLRILLVLLAAARNAVFAAAVYRVCVRDVLRCLRVHGIRGSVQRAYRSAVQAAVTAARCVVPAVDAEVRREVASASTAVRNALLAPEHELGVELRYRAALPASGRAERDVFAELAALKAVREESWRSGTVSGAVYHGGDDLAAQLLRAMGMFLISNPLHPEVFPGVRKMEAEVIAMVRSMFNGPSTACGSITSGGTESLLMAVKTYRDMARTLRGVTHPEMVVPTTAHAAFDKAADYFGVQLVSIPVNPLSGKVDVSAVRRAISSNTILLVGSAPNFPHGIVDDIPALSDLAIRYNIPLHVDCCLGGFIVPFLAEAGYPLPHPVDFSLPGVTSISCDTHKYGFAPKGTSVVLYRSTDIRRYQYFVVTDWPGGTYASPSIAGSRPGALVAGCWTAMMLMGREGYVNSTRIIVSCARKLKQAIIDIPELALIGDPLGSVVAFTTSNPTVSILGLADMLTRRHWHLNILQFPAAIHVACTMLTPTAVDQLIADIHDCIEQLVLDPQVGEGEVSRIYGTAQSVPDRTVLRDVCEAFLDTLTYLPDE